MFFPYLIIAAIVGVAEGESAVCYHERGSFAFKAPDGFYIDLKTAKEKGTCAFVLPESFSWKDSPVVLYTMAEELEPIDDFINRDVERFKKSAPDITVKRAPDYLNPVQLRFRMLEFINGPKSNQFERVACAATKDLIIVAVFSSEDLGLFNRNKQAFIRFLDEIRPAMRETPFDLMNHVVR